MVANPPENMPWITPYIYYEDVAAAMDWLSKAFGLEESERMAGPDGKVLHAEMRTGQGVVMMGCPGPDYQNPKKTGLLSGGVYVYVDDVDGHYERAKAAGAKIVEELADQFYGDRRYRAEDPEGHQWAFGQHVRDVPPEELKLPGT